MSAPTLSFRASWERSMPGRRGRRSSRWRWRCRVRSRCGCWRPPWPMTSSGIGRFGVRPRWAPVRNLSAPFGCPRCELRAIVKVAAW
jgi:hypothetical protein